MQRTSFEDMACSVAQCLDVVGEWWSLLIVRDAFLGVTRFDDFQARLGISRNILTRRLNRLVDSGILKLANLPMPFLAGAMHDDTVKTLPEIAVWLGHSDMYPHQAFRVGPYAWGVQFHPEVSLAGYREWVAERGATDPVALRRMRRGAADFQRLDENVIVGISVLARRFADLVRAFSWRAPRRSIRVGDAVPEA
jgi:DNA-binding Lrp family transcriptional regulator